MKAENSPRFTVILRPAAIAFGAAVAVRFLLNFYAWVFTGISPETIFFGHDGREYLDFARIIGTNSHGPLPNDILRHDPGYPALMALIWNCLFRTVNLPVIALGIQLASLGITLLCAARLYHQMRPGASATIPLLAIALAYPATLYYGLFNLTEPIFTALIVATLVAYANGRTLPAFMLAGLCAIIRSTGLLLVASMLILEFSPTIRPFNLKKFRHLLLWGLVGVSPWILGQALTRHFFGSDVSNHRPQFGWPFSGFRDMANAGLFRSIYIFAAVGLIALSIIRLLLLARNFQWKDRLLNAATAFSCLFFLFHICLKSLYYIDRTVYTFDYQDRYFAPLMPLLVLAWQPFLTKLMTSLAIALSIIISAYWLRNYIAAAGF